jgi:hypothetical protein
MKFQHHIVTSLVGVFFAAVVVAGSIVQVSAQRPWHNTQATCQADGYYWDPVKGCADEYCNDGLMGYGDPGETQVWQGHIYMCDGFTGQWTEVALVHPTGTFLPVAPIIGAVQAAPPASGGPSGPTTPIGGVTAR